MSEGDSEEVDATNIKVHKSTGKQNKENSQDYKNKDWESQGISSEEVKSQNDLSSRKSSNQDVSFWKFFELNMIILHFK